MSIASVEVPELVVVEIEDQASIVSTATPDLSLVEVVIAPTLVQVSTTVDETPVVVEVLEPITITTLVPEHQIVEVVDVTAPVEVEIVSPIQYLEVVENTIRGDPGPTGPPGLVKVTHGSDPNVARPDAPLVYWVGTVTPTNADPDDLLMLKEA